MTRILFDTSRLKREFTRESLQAWAEFLAECNRANFYYKSDGWSQGELVDFDDTGFAEMELKWGDDQNDHEQYSEYSGLWTRTLITSPTAMVADWNC
jgi:hypothetical protein